MEKERFNLLFSAMASAPRQEARQPLVTLGVQAYVIQDDRAAQAVRGPDMALQQGGAASQEDGGHGPDVQAALHDGGEEAVGVGVRFPLNDLPGPPVHAAGVISEHALNLCRRHGQAKRTAHLLRDLIQTADHPQLQASAGGGVGDPVVQAHQVHRPAPDVRQNDRRLVQQFRLGQHGGVALGEQGHLRDGDGAGAPLKPEGHESTVPEKVVPEFLLVSPEAGEGKASRQMHRSGAVRFAAGQFLGDGGEGQEVVILRGGFVLLERLAAATYHIEFAAVFQHILLGIQLMLILHQSGGEGNTGAFHGGVAVIHAYGQGIAHRDFLDHPFTVNRETQDYQELFESIKTYGIREPIKCRPGRDGGVEIISGHRRHDIGMQLNYPIPTIIEQIGDDDAQIQCVDGNLHRKDIPLSELARAAEMKMDALKRKQGRRSKADILSGKEPIKRSDELVGEDLGMSRASVQRLVRVNQLEEPLKKMVDNKKLSLDTAEQISHLKPEEQKQLADAIEKEGGKVPSKSEAVKLKEDSKAGNLTPEKIEKAVAPTKREMTVELKVSFTDAELRPYFPAKTTTPGEAKKAMFEGLALRQKALERQKAQAAEKQSAGQDGRPKKPPSPTAGKQKPEKDGKPKKPPAPTR